jgi:hypothetical protein
LESAQLVLESQTDVLAYQEQVVSSVRRIQVVEKRLADQIGAIKVLEERLDRLEKENSEMRLELGNMRI